MSKPLAAALAIALLAAAGLAAVALATRPDPPDRRAGAGGAPAAVAPGAGLPGPVSAPAAASAATATLPGVASTPDLSPAHGAAPGGAAGTTAPTVRPLALAARPPSVWPPGQAGDTPPSGGSPSAARTPTGSPARAYNKRWAPPPAEADPRVKALWQERSDTRAALIEQLNQRAAQVAAARARR